MTDRSKRWNMTPVGMTIILGLVAGLGIAAAIQQADAPTGTGMDVEARSDGSGTFPDGVADENMEGLRNETSTSDFVESSAQSDSVSPLIEADDARPQPRTNAENIEREGTEPMLRSDD